MNGDNSQVIRGAERRLLFRPLAVLCGLLIAAASIWAQTETGQITGTIVDKSGGVVPNAAITVKSVATGAARTVTTGEAGAYTVANLLPGQYKVAVTAQGFSTSNNLVTVSAGSRTGLDVRLEVGNAQTIVEVNEAAAPVNTENQTLSHLIDENDIKELPTLTRNPYALVATAGNVSEGGPGTRGAGFSINGQRETSTNILLDGASNNDEFTGSIGQQVPLDSVQEINIATSNFTAEFGRASGGIVNVVTKSGSNAFHGTAYEFNRVSRFSSATFDNNANSQPKSVFDRNQFGYSVGGPVKKDKLFFFNSTEWIRVRSGAEVTDVVPAPQLIAAASPNTQAFFAKYGALRSGANVLATYTKDQMVAAGQNPCAGGKVGLCAALPGSTPMFEKIGFTVPFDAGGGAPQNTYMTDARVDYNMTEKTQFYARYALYSELDFNGTLANSPYAGFDLGQTFFNNNILVSGIHTFSPRFVSQTKAVFNRLSNTQALSNGVTPTMYANPNGAVNVLNTTLTFPGYYPSTPGNGGEFHGPQNYSQIYEDLSYNFGKHSLRFGGTYNYIQDNRTYGAYETAVASLAPTNSLGASLDNFLKGVYDSYKVAINPQGKFPCGATVDASCTVNLPLSSPSFSRSNRYNDFAAYVEDSWKVRSRLTLNLGLRWEYFGTQHDTNSNLDANYYVANGPNGGSDGSAASLINYVQNGVMSTVPNSPTGTLWRKNPLDFAPRVGFAWDVFGDGNTALRGGYGIGYERNFGNVTFNIIQNPPNYAVLGVSTSGGDTIPLPISVDNLGPLAGSSGTKALPKVTARVVDPNIKTAYAHLWSLALEHQFAKGITGSLEYSGSKGVDLYTIAYVNRPGYGNFYGGIPCTPGVGGDPGNCTAYLRTTQYSNIGYRGNGGFSDYNALNGRLVIRDVHHTGLNLIANYTWSHAIDNQSSTFFEAGVAGLFNNNITNNNGLFLLGLLDPFNPNLDRGNAEFDQRQRLSLSGQWTIPSHATGMLGKFLGGWSLAPILNIRSGAPFSIFDGTTALNYEPRVAFNTAVPRTGTGVVAVPGVPNDFTYISVPDANIVRFFDPKTGVSDVGNFSPFMTGRDAFTGPGFWNLDFGVYKDVKFGERFHLQLRAETYNIFNHANLYVNGGTADFTQNQDPTTGAFLPGTVSACKGCTGGTVDRRNLQLAAKLVF